jgi:hypothetical protein
MSEEMKQKIAEANAANAFAALKLDSLKPIPQKWIKEYVDSLIEAAKSFGLESKMSQSAMVRADAIMDLVKAFQERK